MITEFCTNCGSKIEYTLKKPNFCHSCGSPLNEKVNEVKPEQEMPSIEKSESETLNVNISKLDYSIQASPNKLTFGDLISQASNDPNRQKTGRKVRPDAKIDPKEDVIKTTMQECRSTREPKDIGGK